MPRPQIETEDDPTPLVMALAADLERRLTDAEFAASTASLRGAAALPVGDGPEAATFEIAERIALRHGATGAQVTAAGEARGRGDGRPVDGEQEQPKLAAWLRDFAS